MRKNTKKILLFLLALSLSVTSFSGCGSGPAPASGTPAQAPSSSAAPSESEPAPSESTPEDSDAKKVLLVISFGTSYNNNRDLSIGSVEKALTDAYPEYEMRRAFTSQIIIDKLKERDGIEIDNVTQAMERLVSDGIKDVVVQPTHVMNGFEYDDIVSEVSPYQEKFDRFKMGSPLLITDEDYQELASVITEETKEYDTDGNAVVFMGHGTEHEANATYAKLQKVLMEGGHSRYFIGTVEAEPTLEDVLALVQASGAKKVTLLPLMIVAGDHANNDMAGDEEDSWKSVFEKAGFEVECVLKGLGQYPGIQEMFVSHVAKTIAE